MAKNRRFSPLRLDEFGPIEVLQPNYDRWNSVSIGMHRQEVDELLGRPLQGPNGFYQPEYCQYGYVRFPIVPCFCSFLFQVNFRDNRVTRKIDPFDGIFSTDGRPSKPKIITPLENSLFTHYPAILDIRWYPASGVYPMAYELEVHYGLPYHNSHVVNAIPFPYHAYRFQSRSPGYIRIRGLNERGPGEWSDFRLTEFTPEQPDVLS